MAFHPRCKVTKRAGQEIEEAVAVIAGKHELTFGELIRILSRIIESEASGAVREERHPHDPEKKADEA